MKYTLALLLILSAIVGALGCVKVRESTSVDTTIVRGYPIYKFLNFGGINEKGFEGKKEMFRKVMESVGGNFDDYTETHARMVSAGFDLHIPLRLITDNGVVIKVYVPNGDYETLWKVNPHDLKAQGKSHCVEIEYMEILVGDQMVNRSINFKADLVDRVPVIMK